MLPGYPDAEPLAGLAGGVLIGLAAALMLLGAGRIAGVSGIAARAFGISDSGISRDGAWAFIIGLPLGALIVAWLSGGLEASFATPVPLAIAGLLVGIGTRMGSGCTSGHGVCGVSRLSRRSLVATATFMAAGIATVAAMNALGFEVLQ
ncbi:YeeE/YedE thiosulfate transporter family protein [Altererythrobacter arenosus]|uniref:YeeE/YedE thiosulfate transporter family protein n=1 Tax=Altererythrobacter arenosus TaxID=3032592 RepID=A0ABY8FRK4_9SPHN|nr:YeeE/YedE thiosulfate transporter family protein [Altererythrobacter sp. CAU 1644]WFL77649.1 YeeE/YedE thiosulfate transporter family protein [Altererythrobacter sp. CAU 1644]